jgi:hypothetical protein
MSAHTLSQSFDARPVRSLLCQLIATDTLNLYALMNGQMFDSTFCELVVNNNSPALNGDKAGE